MPHFYTIFSLIFLLLSHSVQSQSPVFKVEGTVLGFEQAPSQGILKKNKPVTVQGTLENATIKIYLKDKLVQKTYSDEKGIFQLNLNFDKFYKLEVSRKGHNKNHIIIDTRAFPEKIKKGGFIFKGAEFLLNSYTNGDDRGLDKNIGRLYFNPGRKELVLESFLKDESTGIFSSSSQPDASEELLARAIAKNNERLRFYTPLQRPQQKQPVTESPVTDSQPVRKPADNRQEKEMDIDLIAEKEDKLTIPKDFNLPSVVLRPDEDLLRIQEDAIRREREQLTIYRLRIKTQEDSLEIIRREQEIELAEKNIAEARFLISTQKEKLAAQQEKMFLLISLLTLLSCSSFLVFFYFRQKQKVSQLMESKNKQITDSINYARRIQQSILISENTLQQYFSESFVFLQPKAIVSGDFYFVAPIGNKFILAVADCTGHGVPGAFMSLIGYRLLREIVVEKGIHDPAQVLSCLHNGINESLNQTEDKENSQDGMDIAICLIDPEAKTLVFAGAMNPAYLIFNQELNVLQADVSSVGGKTLRPRNEGEQKKFSNKACQYNPGCMLYLFTDGYMDQFGGGQDQKFNTRRFKQMLMDIQPLSAGEQKEIISGTLQEWKRNTPQTDDILMLGIRLT